MKFFSVLFTAEKQGQSAVYLRTKNFQCTVCSKSDCCKTLLQK